jgi:hypothetical protein
VRVACVGLMAAALVLPAAVAGQPQEIVAGQIADRTAEPGAVEGANPPRSDQIAYLNYALTRLPAAAALAAILALRPRRRGTPPRQPQVIQTQIILAIVGAVVMLVVGQSLARAFGIVGAAGLVRYRAKVDDPKDAGVMLSTLAIGLATGVGLWMLATFATGFVLLVLWIIESFEMKARLMFVLSVQAKDPATLRPRVEELLRRSHLEFDLRTATAEALSYEVRLPREKRTDRLATSILRLDPENATGVEWEEKSGKKK